MKFSKLSTEDLKNLLLFCKGFSNISKIKRNQFIKELEKEIKKRKEDK